jgi:hypothetical protein
VDYGDALLVLLNTLRRQGRLVEYGKARRLADGRYAVKVIGLFPPPPRTPWWRTRWARRTAIVLVGVGLPLAAAVWYVTTLVGALVRAAGQLAPQVAAYAALAVIVLVLWLMLSAKRGHACRGLHCPNCPG